MPKPMRVTSSTAERAREAWDRDAVKVINALLRHETGAIRREVERLAARWLPIAERLAPLRDDVVVGDIANAAVASATAFLQATSHMEDLERLLIESVADEDPLSDSPPPRSPRRSQR